MSEMASGVGPRGPERPTVEYRQAEASERSIQRAERSSGYFRWESANAAAPFSTPSHAQRVRAGVASLAY